MTEDVPWIIKVELITEPSINIVTDVGVARISVITVSTAEPCWMDRIVDFLAEYRIPDDEKEASKVRRLSFKKKKILFYLNLSFHSDAHGAVCHQKCHGSSLRDAVNLRPHGAIFRQPHLRLTSRPLPCSITSKLRYAHIQV